MQLIQQHPVHRNTTTLQNYNVDLFILRIQIC